MPPFLFCELFLPLCEQCFQPCKCRRTFIPTVWAFSSHLCRSSSVQPPRLWWKTKVAHLYIHRNTITHNTQTIISSYQEKNNTEGFFFFPICFHKGGCTHKTELYVLEWSSVDNKRLLRSCVSSKKMESRDRGDGSHEKRPQKATGETPTNLLAEPGVDVAELHPLEMLCSCYCKTWSLCCSCDCTESNVRHHLFQHHHHKLKIYPILVYNISQLFLMVGPTTNYAMSDQRSWDHLFYELWSLIIFGNQ